MDNEKFELGKHIEFRIGEVVTFCIEAKDKNMNIVGNGEILGRVYG